ncbi:hypothetical protein OH491_23880 [Termitidicoccus mucosus]|uniref:Uncharacterized protein n=1 Tax=Termitidicoccus mucosus TaxID=1184151 RepID=A0A178INU8_9BACT|nr:hypothetical protein AW736_02615 [Opitutaceae bacterium TSB47]
MKNEQPADGAGRKPVPPENAKEPVLVESLPMARYTFVVRGRLAGGSTVLVRGNVYAKKGMYYQAQAMVLDFVLKEIPALVLDEEAPVGLKMRTGRCRGAPLQDPGIC